MTHSASATSIQIEAYFFIKNAIKFSFFTDFGKFLGLFYEILLIEPHEIYGMIFALKNWRLIRQLQSTTHRRYPMQWTDPSFKDLRFGFEITMYIANR